MYCLSCFCYDPSLHLLRVWRRGWGQDMILKCTWACNVKKEVCEMSLIFFHTAVCTISQFFLYLMQFHRFQKYRWAALLFFLFLMFKNLIIPRQVLLFRKNIITFLLLHQLTKSIFHWRAFPKYSFILANNTQVTIISCKVIIGSLFPLKIMF